MSITTAPAEMMYTPQEVVAREIRGILAKAGIKTQGEVAQILGVARSGAAARLNGKQEFTIGELITLAGALNMSLSELLGDSIVNTKVPAPSYIEEKGKKKVAPIGFVPNGATYQILSGEECALWGSNPRPADYQTQHRAQPPRHADTYTTAPHRGFYIALLLWMCNQSQHTERRENHALGTASKQLYDLATRLRKSNLHNRHTYTLDPIFSTYLPHRDSPKYHRRPSN